MCYNKNIMVIYYAYSYYTYLLLNVNEQVKNSEFFNISVFKKLKNKNEKSGNILE